MIGDASTNWFNTITTHYGWVVVLFFIILATLIASYIEKIAYKRILPRVEKTKSIWDHSLVRALHTPFNIFIWLVGIAGAISYVARYHDRNDLAQFVAPVREVGTVILVVWFLTRFSREVENSLLNPKAGKQRLDKTTLRAITQLVRLAIIITAGLILMQTFGIPISGVVAFGGVGGIAAGFAAKDLLSNFFGGFMLFLDRPFVIGDWIRSPDKEIEGTVENIGWRLTRIRTFDKRPLFVPNGVFSNVSIENPSRMMNRRIKTTVGIRYEDSNKLAAVLTDIEEMLKNHPEIDTTKVLFVKMVNFGPYALEFLIYTFTKTTDWVNFQGIQQDVFLKILEIIASHGAECAYPTTTLKAPEGIEIKNR